jgi:hypothetical protein
VTAYPWGQVTNTTPAGRREPDARLFWRRYFAEADTGHPPEWPIGDVDCPRRVDVSVLNYPTPRYVCGCGRCHRPPPAPPRCCGHTGHSPEPGIGCTNPACLCLEPVDLPGWPAPTGEAFIRAYHDPRLLG